MLRNPYRGLMWVATESAPARVNHAHGPGASRGGEHGESVRAGASGARALGLPTRSAGSPTPRPTRWRSTSTASTIWS